MKTKALLTLLLAALLPACALAKAPARAPKGARGKPAAVRHPKPLKVASARKRAKKKPAPQPQPARTLDARGEALLSRPAGPSPRVASRP
jgi:hypothetical protein